MDIVSYSVAAKQKQRIEQVIANPDSTSGVVTTPSVIAVGETINIPAGRTAVLPNTTVNGTLVVDGEVFIPSGSSISTTEVDATVVKQNGNVVATLASPTFTGTVTLPSTTSIGAVSSTELGFLDGVTSNIQTQFSNLASANNASVKSALNATGSAPIYACRAWVNFNGTGTVATRASGNISSITDNGVGDYTVNFTTAMPDANYGVDGTAGNFGSAGFMTQGITPQNQLVSSVRFRTPSSNTNTDFDNISVSIFR